MIKGSQHTEESKQKMSLVHKGRPLSDEHKRKISQTLNGKRKTDEHRQHIGEASKGRKHSNAARLKMRNAHLGKTRIFSEEHRISLSTNHARLSGKNHPMYGKHRSIETRRKISMARLGMQFSEEHKKNISIVKQNVSQETRGKLRKARLKQAFPSKDTSIEIIMQNELRSRGIKFETHIPVCGICQPDITISENKLVIQCDGDYWHSKDFKNGKVWKRDHYQDQILRENGWTPLRFWGHEIREDVIGCVDKIIGSLGVGPFGN